MINQVSHTHETDFERISMVVMSIFIRCSKPGYCTYKTQIIYSGILWKVH